MKLYFSAVIIFRNINWVIISLAKFASLSGEKFLIPEDVRLVPRNLTAYLRLKDVDFGECLWINTLQWSSANKRGGKF